MSWIRFHAKHIIFTLYSLYIFKYKLEYEDLISIFSKFISKFGLLRYVKPILFITYYILRFSLLENPHQVAPRKIQDLQYDNTLVTRKS